MMGTVTTTQAVSLVLTVLAVARLTRLVNADVLTERPRVWLLNRLDGHQMLQYLLVCPWCLSMYLGAGGAAAWWVWGSDTRYTAVCLVFTASYVAGWLGSKEND